MRLHSCPQLAYASRLLLSGIDVPTAIISYSSASQLQRLLLDEAMSCSKQLHACCRSGGMQRETSPMDSAWSPCMQIGAVTNTFGVPGVEENCFYMKSAEDAKALRERINACFELANLPDTTDEERRRLLSFVIVSSCRYRP